MNYSLFSFEPKYNFAIALLGGAIAVGMTILMFNLINLPIFVGIFAGGYEAALLGVWLGTLRGESKDG